MVKIGNVEIGEFPLLLAPMEDVSDPPFRAVCKENGADMMYTEFISSEGLIRHADKSVQKLDIYDYERPIGIQIFGDKIESMRQAAAIAEEAGPEVVDYIRYHRSTTLFPLFQRCPDGDGLGSNLSGRDTVPTHY